LVRRLTGRSEALARVHPDPLLVALLAVYAVLLVLNGWMGDDAFITYATADNFLNGHGLRFNIDERVQAYTNPLMLACMIVASFFTHEGFLTTIAINIITSLVAMWLLLFRLAPPPRDSRIPKVSGNAAGRWSVHWSALLAAAVLLFSKSFVDYSTSGLENSLEHLLVAVFAIPFLRTWRFTPRQLLGMSLLGSLMLLNRMDSILLVAPALAFCWLFARKGGFFKSLLAGLAGLVPFLLWEVFAFLYYGSLVPNTALAKLNTGIPTAEYLRQGLSYYLTCLRYDPVGMGAVHLAVLVTVWIAITGRGLRLLCLGAGICCYVIYQFRIGGDFMVGRHYSACIFLAAMIIARLQVTKHQAIAFLIPILILGLTRWANPFTDPTDYDENGYINVTAGIADERRFYPTNTLVSWARTTSGWRSHDFALAARDASGEPTMRATGIGMTRLVLDSSTHLIDELALADPLLSRLPTLYNPNFRIGHFYRVLPAGYEKTLATGKNAIADPGLREYYEIVRSVTRDPIWSADRIEKSVNLALGRYDYLIDYDRYRYPAAYNEAAASIRYDDLQHQRLSPDTAWNAPGVRQLAAAGARIALTEPVRTKTVSLGVSTNDNWIVYYLRDNAVVDTDYRPPGVADSDSIVNWISHPAATFDTIVITPQTGDNEYGLGYLECAQTR
jgi:arabinofuranosyltransferase